ncbi:MAG: HAMP domain-containing sensor histidine kinase [Bacteroidota bacterium]
MSTQIITPAVKVRRISSLSVNLFTHPDPLPKIKTPGEDFFSALAHEVRNPLTNINISAEMLKHLITDDAQKVYLDIIMRSSIRINNLVNELLHPAEAEDLLVEKHSIHQLLDEVLAMNEDRIMLKNITVVKEYDVQDHQIVLNKPKMKIALINIIINAIDAMPFEKGQLKLMTRSVNDKCVIEIGDNGSGISKKNLKNIFKPYFTNKPGGMGIGLSATLDILLSNHVKADVQSVEGIGTRFILLFKKISTSREFAFPRYIPAMG